MLSSRCPPSTRWTTGQNGTFIEWGEGANGNFTEMGGANGNFTEMGGKDIL